MTTEPLRCAETTPESWAEALREKQRQAEARLAFYQREGRWPEGRERAPETDTLPALLRRQAW